MDSSEKTITITYETLFEILRREKDRLELQKLDASFYEDVSSYIKDKNKILSSNEASFSDEEKLKTQKQLINIKKILKEIYERREKKIINLALDKCKANSNNDTSVLLDEEKSMFESLVRLLGSYREGILDKVVKSEIPVKVEAKEEVKEFKTEEKTLEKEPVSLDDIPAKEEVEEKTIAKEESPTKMILFKHAVPKFVGLEGEEFGPFDEEDMASLPSRIADVLVKKNRAEEIKEE